MFDNSIPNPQEKQSEVKSSWAKRLLWSSAFCPLVRGLSVRYLFSNRCEIVQTYYLLPLRKKCNYEFINRWICFTSNKCNTTKKISNGSGIFFVKYSSNIKIFFTAFSFLLIVTQFSGNDGQDDESYAQLLRDEENGSNFSNPPRYVICWWILNTGTF